MHLRDAEFIGDSGLPELLVDARDDDASLPLGEGGEE